jgi:hypothetical protein
MRSFLVLALLALAQLSSSSIISDTFELEGNTIDSPAGFPDDWASLWVDGVPQVDTRVLSRFSVVDTGLRTTYAGGSSKDVNDISSWRYVDGASVPAKADFNNVFGASYLEQGAIIACFGGDMLDRGTGTVTVGLWFTQQGISLASGGRFTGLHTTNDVLLVIDFSGARAEDAVSVTAYKWDPSVTKNLAPFSLGSGDFKCGTGTADIATVCATYNTAPISPLPFRNNVNTLTAPTATFWEGCVNFNRLFGGAQNVPCFSTVIAETRASNAKDSTLQDFTLASFPICGAESSATCGVVAETSPGSGVFTATFTLSVQNTGIGTLTVTALNTQNLPNGATAIISPALPTTISGGGATQVFTITYSGLPAATFSPQVQVVFASPGPASIVRTATCPLVRLSVQKACTVSVASGTLVSPNVAALYLKVTWLVTVQNTGQAALEGCRVTDVHGSTSVTTNPIPFIEGGTGLLPVGVTKTFQQVYIPSTPIGFTFSDTATVTCTASGTAFTATASATTSCSLCPGGP